MLQLNPPIPVWVPSRSMAGMAMALIDYSQEHDTLWVVALQDGEFWTLRQSEVRAQENCSLGRPRSVAGAVSSALGGLVEGDGG